MTVEVLQNLLEDLSPDDITPAGPGFPVLSSDHDVDHVIERMRARHHQVARYIAEGKPAREAAFIVGLAPTTVQGYMSDPAFRELVEYYKAQVNVEYLDMHHKLGILAATAAGVLQDRLEEKPAAFTNNELRQIISDACDRSVAPAKGPGSAPAVSISVKFVEAQKPVLDLEATNGQT